MSRHAQQFGPMALVNSLAMLILFTHTGSSHATIVGAQSYGDELAGARISVHFVNSGVHFATVVVGGPDHGTANDPGFFTFNVTGDTFLADWSLRNDTTSDSITLVEFDLAGTSSQPDPNGPVHSPGVLFDNNASPSTPNGFAGRQGAVQVNVGAPFIVASFEQAPQWADPMNTGDEWVREAIEYQGFGPLLTSVWRDDTDIVGVDTGPELPEPASVALIVMAALVIRPRWPRNLR
jgi:hypothetical protein